MRAHFLSAAVVMCFAASGAAAQDGLRSASLPERTPQNPIPAPRVDQFVAGPRTYTPRLPGEQRRRHFRPHVQGSYGLPLGYGYFSNDVVVPRETAPEAVPNGYLFLQLQPVNAEVRVDGFYMGTVDDFRRLIPGRSIEAGPHRIEISAPGYETVSFDVFIAPNETVTYRRDLQAVASRERVTALPPGPPKTFYVIPGCYAGDKPPKSSPLPRGCDRLEIAHRASLGEHGGSGPPLTSAVGPSIALSIAEAPGTGPNPRAPCAFARLVCAWWTKRTRRPAEE